jgi:predicted flap endonuclease-1-like 5' DNA nuclease
MTRLTKIEGIGPVFAEKLEQAGVSSIEELLDQGASPAGRKELTAKTDISATLILEWINRADLARVKGIGEEYADLLEASGVDTVPELAQRNPQNLYQKLGEVNAEKSLVRRMPGLAQVEDWVTQAKNLPRKVTY